MLRDLIGEGTTTGDVPLEAVLTTVPPSRLPDHALITTDPEVRLRHARGQSLPDWVALRSGRVGTFPDGVARPRSETDVEEILSWGAQLGARLIPYGGGTSVVGHINPLPDDHPVVTVDMRRLNQMHRFDEGSRLATFAAGISGPELESQLRARGHTLGHFPQSFEYSTLGGWVATHSSGQQSLGYGRIEDLFAGGRLVAPAGSIALPAFPASAAGPDLRDLVLGSEGRLGIITEATVQTTPLPEREEFHGVFFPDFATGRTAVREMVQHGLPLSMLRLSSPTETRVMLALAGHPRAIGALETALSLRKLGDSKTMLMMGLTGTATDVRRTRRAALGIARRHGGVHIGRPLGSRWRASRFTTPYLRNTLWEMGYAIDTFETATDWTHVATMTEAIEGEVLPMSLAETGGRVLVMCHISHVYPTGASIYTTCIFPLGTDPDGTLDRWRRLKRAASETVVSNGGTISHHHGVGVDHAAYLEAEKGRLGIEALGDVMRRFDPDGVMNPGKLIP